MQALKGEECKHSRVRNASTQELALIVYCLLTDTIKHTTVSITSIYAEVDSLEVV